MARFRAIEREHIIMRRTEANACLHYGLYHSATLTACSGIELLLEYLFSRLHEDLARHTRRRANALLDSLKTEERRNQAKTSYWGLKSWADFYRRQSIFDLLCKQFGFRFALLNDHTLTESNEIWNKCKHDPYLATPEIARRTVHMLNAYLQETEIKSEALDRRQLTIGEMSAQWLGQWEKPLTIWVARNQDAPQTLILMYLAPLLDLIIRLLDDHRVSFELKSPLMVAANYVFSSIDLVPENVNERDVSGLVDDGAVLALSLYWLSQQDSLDKAILYSHWPGGEAIVDETRRLRQHIWMNQATLFPDGRRQIGFELIWKVIERVATDGPEALWQNYWKEQSVAEVEGRRF